MNNFLNEKIMPKIMAFINTKAISALKDGLLYSMPLLIIGSVFLLIANFPYTPIALWLTNTGVTPILNQAYGATFNIMAMVAVVGICYTYVKNEGYEALSPAVIALACFLLLQPSSIRVEGGGTADVILKDWTSGKGMVVAIVIGLLVGWLYSWFMKKKIRITMPAGVPSGVANSFVALLPAAIIISGVTIVYAVFKLGFDTTFVEWIYTIIQTPLQGLTDSLGGVIIMGFLVPFFWFFGVHGSTIVSGIMSPILQANSAANQAIITSGKELTIENGGHIVTMQFFDQFLTVTGAGITIGVVLFLVLFAKSKQNNEIGKLGLIPGLFNINEPVLFGIPIVLNPIIAIPFMFMPVLSGVIQYFAIASGLCPLYTGVMVPWTTPPIISGFLIGGWRTAFLQTFILVLSFFVYFPFIKKIDSMNYANEQLAANEKSDKIE